MSPSDVPGDRTVDPPSARLRPLYTAAAVAAVVLAEGAWRLADGRLPSTDRAPLVWIADLHVALDQPELPLGALVATLVEPGGWFAVLAAAVLRVVGRSPEAFELLLVAIGSVFVLGAGRAAWGVAAREARAGGPAGRVSPDVAAALAVLLAASLPWATLGARDGALAIVGAAPAALLLAVAAADPGLRRRGTVLAAAFGGAFALVPGAGGGVWAGLAAVAFALEAIRLHRARAGAPAGGAAPAPEGPRYGRLGAVGGVWAIASVAPVFVPHTNDPPRPPMPPRPAVELLGDLAALVGVEGGAILGLAAVAALVARLRRHRAAALAPPAAPSAPPAASPAPLAGPGPRLLHAARRLRDLPAAEVLLIAAAAWPLLAAALGGTRPDRLAAAVVPLAALAALALARHAWGLPVALGGWLAFTVPQHLDGPLGPSVHASVVAAGGPFRPLAFDVAATLGALLDASCASDGWRTCRVVVETSLLGPDAEDPGRLARFLLAEDRVALATVYDVPRGRGADAGIDALLTFACPATYDRAMRRVPDAPMRVVELAAALNLAPAWSGPLGVEGCRAHWLVPGGAAPRADRLPPADAGPTWTPFGALSALDAFYARNPTIRGRQGRGSASAGTSAPGTPGWLDRLEAPEGWSASRVEGERVRTR